MTCKRLEKLFPDTEFDFIDAGIPSTDTALAPFRQASTVFHRGRVDLLFVEFAVDGGSFKQVDQYTQWSHYLHIPWAYILAANLKPGKHTLTLRMSRDKNPKSEGHAARIVKFLAN